VREIPNAIADLERAAALQANRPDAVEPDGLPNARNVPTGTNHTNILYHLGLAYYVSGEYERAAAKFRDIFRISRSPDNMVSAGYWLYLSLRRLKRDDMAREAIKAITPDLDVIENHAYHRLLLVYRGERSADSLLAEARQGGDLDFATIGYGLAMERDLRGLRPRAVALWREVLKRPNWPAFGYLAAEMELKRLGEKAR
jgi:tetratricopeptide (TPR) repeat protein